jgi:branched-chain amino acid transport system substrate-binding protein
MLKRLLLGSALLTVAVLAAKAQNDIKIGFVTTFSGAMAVVGTDMRDGFELALDHLGRKMAGRNVTMIYEDDGLKPEQGKQKTDKLIQSDKVDFLTGYMMSHILLASVKSAIDAETFLISANAGPSQIAGESCSPWFFSTSWQGDQVPQAVGEYMNQKGVKTAYLLAPNYAAGKDVLAGVKANFKGQIVGEDYTKWPDQLDFSVELSKVRNIKPDAVFAFYPGAAGIQFLTQYSQSGLRGQIPLYTSFIVDALSLPRLTDLALNVPGAQHWVIDLPNDANKKFVADFKRKYDRNPSFYAAQAYDSAMLIDSAVKAVGGDITKKDAMRDAMRDANYASVRGSYKYGNNHFPIQNFYLQEAVKDDAGAFTLKTTALALKGMRIADRMIAIEVWFGSRFLPLPRRNIERRFTSISGHAAASSRPRSGASPCSFPPSTSLRAYRAHLIRSQVISSFEFGDLRISRSPTNSYLRSKSPESPGWMLACRWCVRVRAFSSIV